jgi:hypothetical protein
VANIFTDNFEANNLSLWGTPVDVTVVGGSLLDGTYCAELAADDSRLPLAISPALSEIYVSLDLKAINATGCYGCVIVFMHGSTILGMLYAAGSGVTPITYKLEAWKGYFGTKVGLHDVALSYADKHTVQVRYKPHSTAGIFQVKLDGTLVIDFAGSTCASDTTVDNLRLGEGSSDSFYFHADNVLVDDADWPATSSTTTRDLTTSCLAVSATSTFPLEQVPETSIDMLGVSIDGGFLLAGGGVISQATPPRKALIGTGGFLLGGSRTTTAKSSRPPGVALIGNGGFVWGGGFLPTVQGISTSIRSALTPGGFVLGGAATIQQALPRRDSLVGSGGFLFGAFRVNIPTPPTPERLQDVMITLPAGFAFGGEGIYSTTLPAPPPLLVPSVGAQFIFSGAGISAERRPARVSLIGEGGFVIGGSGQDQELWDVWVLNGSDFEPAYYFNFNFNSYATFRGQIYAAKDDGIYRLGAPGDDGQGIPTAVRIGPTDLGDGAKKRLRSLILPHGEGARVRIATARAKGVFPVQEGRAMISRNLQGRAVTIDIADFQEISQVEIVPLIMVGW